MENDMTLPNMDTRLIKRLSNDHFTVEPLSSMKDPDRLLCNHCALAKCKVRNYVQRVPSEDAVLKVQSCSKFIPTLGFSVLHGLDKPLWNTVRIGAAWENRLNDGAIVAVADTKNGKMVRRMRVEKTFTGQLQTMLAEHAKFNHAILSEVEDGKIEETEAPGRLLRILKNAYGTNIAAADRAASVIYLGLLE